MTATLENGAGALLAFTHKGQVYVAVERLPHTRRDGSNTELIRWKSECAECGRPFTFCTPAKAKKMEPNRRCQRCKRPGQRVRGAACS